MEIIKKSATFYHYLFDEVADPRTKDWLFIGKPYQGILLIIVYLFYVLKWGPKWMKNRQPFNLKKVLIIYNAFQVAACAFILFEGIRLGWFWKFKMFCEPVDYSRSEHALQVAHRSYLYFLMKIVDLLDTVFIVLRKKNDQVSFLHVYHHAGMVALIWGAVTYFAGGHGTLIGVVNSFVHTVMYFYYLLSVITPSINKHLWFKKLITQLQIVQFLWFVIHMGVLVFIPDCQYPRWTAGLFLPQNLFMLFLFTDFYIKAYIKPKPKKQTMDSTKKDLNNGDYKNGGSSIRNLVNSDHLKDTIRNRIVSGKNEYDNSFLSNNIKIDVER